MKFPHLRALGRGSRLVPRRPRWRACRTATSSPRRAPRPSAASSWPGVTARRCTPLAYHWGAHDRDAALRGGDSRAAGRPEILAGELASAGTRTGHGVGIIEAPRGTLIHDYDDVGEDDLVTRCNLIVSTTHNNQAMNEAVRQVARQYLDGHEITEGLLNRIEVAIRAYDPLPLLRRRASPHAAGRGRLLDAAGGVTRC